MSLFPQAQLFDAAYTVSRGVRALALVGSVAATPEAMSEAEQELFRCGSLYGNTCPLVLVSAGPHRAECGYATHSWVVDLYRWCQDESLPLRQRERVLGLLLGYSAEAIHRFDDEQVALALRNWSVGRRDNP